MRPRSLRAATAMLAAIGLVQLPACGRSYLEVRGDAGAPGRIGSTDDGGAVVDTAMDAPAITCPPGQTACNDTCVDTQTDQGNCGGCGLSCPQPCNAGRCLAVFAANQAPLFIAVDRTRVGWINGFGMMPEPDDDAVMTAPKTGGMPTKLAPLDTYGNIALTDTNAYWTDMKGLETEPVGGGQEIFLGGNQYAAIVAVDPNNLYWVDQGPGVVMRMPLTGGTPTTLAPHEAWGLAVDSTSVYMLTVLGVMKVPVGGGAVVTLARDLVFGSIAASPAGVFVARNTGIYRVPPDGGAMETLVPDESCDAGFCPAAPQLAETIAADATHVYWTGGPASDEVLEMPVGGGSPVTLAKGGTPGPIAVDDTSVYWGDTLAGVIVRLTPK